MASLYPLEDASTSRVTGYVSLLASPLEELIPQVFLCYHSSYAPRPQIKLWSMKWFLGGGKFIVFWNNIFETSWHASLPCWNMQCLIIKFPEVESLRLAFQGNEA